MVYPMSGKRKYQPIWEHLKLHMTADIVAPIAHHGRIVQAVRKEKCKDITFTLECSLKGIKYQMLDTRDLDKQLVKFKLVPTKAEYIQLEHLK